MIELKDALTVVSVGIALWSVIRVEQVRRQAGSEELRKKQAEDVVILQKKIDLEGSILREKLEIEHLKISILEARLKPLLDSFDKRLADMFHNNQ